MAKEVRLINERHVGDQIIAITIEVINLFVNIFITCCGTKFM